MMDKPEWKDAPKWAKHLWHQGGDGHYCWSASKRQNAKALWTTDKDNDTNRFELWLNCWDYQEERP